MGERQLAPSDEAGEPEFGTGVALSARGDTALVGGSGGEHRVGAAWIFTNPAPSVVTGSATGVAQGVATLNATVNPAGEEVTACSLEYGTTVSYGSAVPCAVSPGSGSVPVAVSASAVGLVANTVYHYRVSAAGRGGDSYGEDQAFRTLPSPPTAVTGAASAVGVSYATLNAMVNPMGGR
jgi:hypothetical protein